MIKSRCAIKSVAIAQRDPPIAQRRSPIDQILRRRGTFEKTEGTPRTKLHVGQVSHTFRQGTIWQNSVHEKFCKRRRRPGKGRSNHAPDDVRATILLRAATDRPLRPLERKWICRG